MIRVRKRLPLLLVFSASITVLSFDALAVDKDKAKFTPPDLDSIPAKQTIGDVTVGAVPYDRSSLAETAFGKVDPYEHGVLPIFVSIRNNSKQTVRLDSLKVQYRDRDRRAVDATPAAEVPFVEPPKRPTFGGPTIPGITNRKKKNPLQTPEIETRAFSAKMLPPGESAYGFFYFRTLHKSGANIYVTGMREASSGKDLFYFDFPLD
jgi:hypothetical protein